MFFSKIMAQAVLLSGAGPVAWAKPINSENDVQVESTSFGSLETLEIPTVFESEAEVNVPMDDLAELAQLQINLSSDETEALRLHNAARATKNIQPLIWDAGLAANASAYATFLKNTNLFQHSLASTRPNQGENLAYNQAPYNIFTGAVVNPITNPLALGTQQWLNESQYYKGETMPGVNFGKYGHYTQIMWKNTTRVGVASATNGRAWWIVARYSPPGNVMGQKPY